MRRDAGRAFQISCGIHGTRDVSVVRQLLLTKSACRAAQVEIAQISAELIARKIQKRGVAGELTSKGRDAQSLKFQLVPIERNSGDKVESSDPLGTVLKRNIFPLNAPGDPVVVVCI